MTFSILAAFYVLGAIAAVSALWRSRTPQGTTAWVIALISFPFLALPLFMIFGRNRFYGYVKERKEYDRSARKELSEIEHIFTQGATAPVKLNSLTSLADKTIQPGFTVGNKIDLLINGEKTYESMIGAIEKAEKYILVQFYIFRCDEIGQKFIRTLVERAEAGVKVYFLCDKFGTSLKKCHLKDMKKAGIEFNYFFSTKSWISAFQMNFRNHRKNVVIDGKVAFIGGHNVGDDYLGKWKKIGFWRDTHLKITGPAVLAAQLSFVKDWYWTHDVFPNLDWQPSAHVDGVKAMVLHTGPADEIEACNLAHVNLINAAEHRVWIATPYFVPPAAVTDALILAAARGVDVRVIVPTRSDNYWVQRASKVFIEKLSQTGVRFFQYDKGFLHQKVLIADSSISSVGSANLDHRSFFLNFEITGIVEDTDLNAKLEDAFMQDLKDCTEVTYEHMLKRPLWRQIVSRAVSLMAPML